MSYSFTAPPKHPLAEWNASLSLARWMRGEEVIVDSPQATVEPITDGITIDNVSNDETTVFWRVSGGEVGQDYFVRISAYTSAGQREVVRARFPVREV